MPLRAGLTMVKDARKVGRLGEGLTQWAGRSAREVVDTPVLHQAVMTGSVLRPGETVSAIRAASGMSRMPSRKRILRKMERRPSSLLDSANYGTSCRVWVVCAVTASLEKGSANVVPPYHAAH